ncbi:MAG: hypothetical protein Faunusvirus5_30 [Faunusvirus sp.]|jgi:hypothetical protein|uniref:Uncharacterized protein n=1 Tax=Faunusvirus sp. TaxID=2487766 RepID=A0A3G4ZYY4_9VIRU|nr:MAG: hypothetical protein Faunusvirus5_30 [Faunusvirus sp.]
MNYVYYAYKYNRSNDRNKYAIIYKYHNIILQYCGYFGGIIDSRFYG